MKKLFFIPFVLGILIGSNSCNVQNYGNTTTFPAAPVVVEYDASKGGVIMNTPWGCVAAPSLAHPFDVSPFDGYYCLYALEFTVDYDNQPTTEYYTAINIEKEDIDKFGFLQKSSIELEDYTLVLSNLSGAASEFYNGKFFIAAQCKDKAPEFIMVYNTEEPEEDNIKNLYVLAKPSSSSASSSDITTLGAFDLSRFINLDQGRDTTLYNTGSSTGYDYKYIKANLKYLSGITDGEPKFESVSNFLYVLIPISK